MRKQPDSKRARRHNAGQRPDEGDTAPVRSRDSRSCILVIDPDQTCRSILTRRLENSGFRVTPCADSADGLARAEDAPPDLIITEYVLPNLSGARFIARLRGVPGCARTPLVVLTARTGEADAIAALDAGADDHMTKPLSLKGLEAVIRARLRARACS